MPTYNESRPVVVCDTECYVDYWSIGFKSPDGRKKVFELYEDHPLDTRAIASIFRKYQVIGFNSIKYDMPMIMYAMSGATNAELKRASDELIQFGTPHWVLMERLGLTIPDFVDHVDLMNVSPGAPQMPSLKIYAGRLHSRKMQELPIAIDQNIGEEDRDVIRAYHENDLDVTLDLMGDLKAQLELRRLMSIEYGVDLRSKSDAQIAEAVIKTEIERATGRKIYAPDIVPGYFDHVPPEFIRFQTPQMQEVLRNISISKFVIERNGIVKMPDYLKDADIKIGSSVYRMGLGGLHSSEQRVSHYSDDEFLMLDRDVTSYYPNIILTCHLFPKHIGAKFLSILKRIYDRRLTAKRAGDKNPAETLKIVLNGTFGKLGSPYSAFYSPSSMIQTTITGQLAILMLIEEVELNGMQVVSANTDGFVTRVPRARRDDFNAMCLEWEWATGFYLEETEYRSLHSRDVNNYIAIYEENGKTKIKVKGAFAASGPGLPGASGQKKNPNMDICTDAVVEYLKNGTPLEETIEWCADVRKFLTVRRVKGGAVKNGESLGKALRWYYSTEVQGGFVYASNGNAVPESIGGKLMMELLPHVPADIDYAYYVREAYAILQDLGVKTVDPKLAGRRGTVLARLPDFKSIHVVNVESGVAVCGKARASIRDSWIEFESIPDGHKMCGKCKREGAL